MASIPVERQIMMTAKGKNVQTQTLATENEIFVYDRRYLSERNAHDFTRLRTPEPWLVDDPPDTLRSQNDLESWRALCMARRSWAIDLAHRCIPMYKSICQLSPQVNIIIRGVSVALENLKVHVAIMESRFRETRAWASNVIRDQQSTIANWKSALENTKMISTPTDLTFFWPHQGKGEVSTGHLIDYLDVRKVEDAGSQLPAICDRFRHDVGSMEELLQGITTDIDSLVESAKPVSLPKADKLFDDVETISKKIDSDYTHVLQLSNNPRALPNVPKLAFNHTTNLLPLLMTVSRELYDVHKEVIRQRNEVVPAAVISMQRICQVQSRLADLRDRLDNLDVSGDIFDTVYEVFELPVLYGVILIEAVRRREWEERVEKAVSTITEDIVLFTDEEAKQRKDWVSSMSGFVTTTKEELPKVAISVLNKSDWPVVSRDEVDAYIRGLKPYRGMEATIDRLTRLVDELDTPFKIKQNSKLLKDDNSLPFDRGLSLKDWESLRSLNDEKTALEEKLRSSETRIHRLEDLLHRQSEMSRPNSAKIESYVLPAHHLQPRQSRTTSRWLSFDQVPEGNALMQRVATLEAELAAEKEKTARLESELTSQSCCRTSEVASLTQLVNALKTDLANAELKVTQLETAAAADRQASAERIQDAVSIKQDLMGNIQAQQREFEHERKELEEEIKTLNLKLEEAEDHLEAADKERLELQVRMELLTQELAAPDLDKTLDTAKVSSSVQGMLEEKDAALSTLIECLKRWYTTLAPGMAPLDEDNIRESFSAVNAAINRTRNDSLCQKAREVSHRLYSLVEQLCQMLEQLGFAVVRECPGGRTIVQRQRHNDENGSVLAIRGKETPESKAIVVPVMTDKETVEWATTSDSQSSEELYQSFLTGVDNFPVSSFTTVIAKRMRDIEAAGRKWRKNARTYRDQYHRAQAESSNKISYREFRGGDLALFLPTRNEPLKSWAAFNVGAPHRFLRPSDAHQLATRDWLVARITKIEEHVVDNSKSSRQKDDANSLAGQASDRQSIISVGGYSTASEVQDESNPFHFAEGQKWYFLDAVEEKPGQFISGAPATPALGKITVAAANIDVQGSIRVKKATVNNDGELNDVIEEETVTKTLLAHMETKGPQTSNEKRGVEDRNKESRRRGSHGSADHAEEQILPSHSFLSSQCNDGMVRPS
ncbi:oligomeric, coiled-coil, peripheral membrane protein [Ascosphaera aggregata]|nr:oligomeric, coiled-coil, peripheral membrane protein [Ascosphaera aggregata]